MKREGKKYIIKESELKEIAQEMLMELYNPDDHKDMYTKHYTGSVPNLGDAIKGVVDVIKAAPGVMQDYIPDSVKQNAAQGNIGADSLQWLLSLGGATAPGTAGPDRVPDIFHWSKQQNGPNANAEQQLNVNAACTWLRSYAKRKSSGWCARYVRMALNRGGLSLPHGMSAGYAKDYLRILPKNGWDEIPANEAGQPGDVVVVGPYPKHQNGHIAMCIGDGQWASDFLQKTMHGMKRTPPASAIHVFRYRNRI
jgi:hypothetical protein